MNAPSKIALWYNEPEARALLAQIDIAKVEYAEPRSALTGYASSVIPGFRECTGADFETICQLERLTKVRRAMVDRLYGTPFSQCKTNEQARPYLAFDAAQPDEWAALQSFAFDAQQVAA